MMSQFLIKMKFVSREESNVCIPEAHASKTMHVS